MSNPVQKTLDALTESHNALAGELLLAGLQLNDEALRTASLGALLKRRSTRTNVEVIRRLPQFSPDMRAVLEKQSALLGQAVRQSLLHGDHELRRNALAMVRWFEDYSQVPTLLTLLEDLECLERVEVALVIRDLVNRLYEHQRFGRTETTSANASFLRDAARIRHQVIASLESASQRFDAHRCPAVIECLLVLGDPEDLLVKKVLKEGTDECRAAAAEILMTSVHPGVMSLVVDAMTQNYPLPGAASAFERRDDLEFICHLLRQWPRKLSPLQQKNFRMLKKIAWLEPGRFALELIPPGLQGALIGFLVSTGIENEHKFKALEWVVKHGGTDGRLSATEALLDLESNKVQEVIIDGLTSQEPQVQAWATSQLRAREVPHAFELLVERLDSDLPAVREAARRELRDFDLFRVLEMYDFWDARLRLAVGALLLKIDVKAIDKLRQELSSSIRRRRIRAARAALGLGLHEHVETALLLMAQDSDTLVRRTAVEVLAHVRSQGAREALQACQADGSPRVREAAALALREARDASDRSHPTAPLGT